MPRLSEDETAELFLAACRAEIGALKPGNVHLHAGGHGMETAHFEASAAAAAPWIADRALNVGLRIQCAVEASIAAAGLNTNLGILLLRLMTGLVFATSGYSHLKDPTARAKDIGMPKSFTIFLGIGEVAGGLGVAVGVLTQLAAFGLILLAALVGDDDQLDASGAFEQRHGVGDGACRGRAAVPTRHDPIELEPFLVAIGHDDHRPAGVE